MASQLIFLRVHGTLFLCAATVEEVRGRARSLERTRYYQVLLVVPRKAKEVELFHIWVPNSGIAFLIMFGVQPHSLFKSRLKTHLLSQALI